MKFLYKSYGRFPVILSLLIFSFCGFNLSAQPLETVIQMGHLAEINAVKRSEDGKLLLTGSKDKTVKLWNAETGAEIRTFSGQQSPVTSIAFNRKGNLVASTSVDGTLKLWDVYSGSETYSWKGEDNRLTDVAFFAEDFILVGGYEDSVRFINFRTGAVKTVARANSDMGGGNGVSVNPGPGEKLVAVGEDNRSVSVYEADSWKKVLFYEPTDGSSCGGCGTRTSFSPDLRFLAKASENTNVKIIDLLSGQVIAETGEELDDVTGVEFSEDGKLLLFASDEKAFIADTRDWKVVKEIIFSKDNVKSVVFSEDASTVITGGSDNLLTIYNISDGNVKRTIRGIANDADKGGMKYDINSYWQAHIARYISLKNPILLLPGDKQYIKGKGGTSLRTWNIRSGEPKISFTGHKSAVLSLDRFGRDTIVSGDLDGHVIVWDHNTGKVIKEFDWYREPVFEVAFSSDGKKVLSTSWDGGLYVYDLETNERTGMILQENSVFSACFSPDNLYLVVSKLGKTLEMIEPESKSIVRTFAGHTENVTRVRYLKSGKSIISASWDGTIRIWDPATGLMTRKFKPGKGAIFDFAVQGNDQVVIAAGADRVIRFVSLKDGSILKELRGHNTEITTIKMNQAETMVISQSIDGVIKFWDIDKGKELFEHIHLGSDDWMVRVPSGYFNATAGARDKINFVRGVETFSPDQFFEKFYRPEILKKALGTNSSLHNELEKSPLNVAKIAVTPVEGEKSAVVRLKIYDNGGGVDEVKLMHNGKRLEVDMAEARRSGNPPVVEYSDTLSLVAGKNIFTVSSFNKSRFESKSAESEVFSNIVEKSATCHMFVVGINKYRNKSMSLNYAKDDAEGFAKLIGESSKGLFGQIKIHELYDENATRQNILDTLEMLSHKIHLHDVFIFFYAGHGSISENNFFLVPTECVRAYDESILAREGVSAGDLQENLKKIKALKQIIILDACHSGGSVEMLAMRGSQEERAISQLARSAGIHILASAGSEQTAKEIPELKHGIFTHVLLKALAGAADGAPSDGKITVYELKSYLDDQVPAINEQYSGKAQYPHTFSRGQDFPVVTGK